MQSLSLSLSALTDNNDGLGALGAALSGHGGDGLGDDDGFFGHSGVGECSRGGGRKEGWVKKKEFDGE